MNKKSGVAGVSGIVLIILAIILIPRLFKVLGGLIILALVLIIAFIIALLVFAFKSGGKTGSGNSSSGSTGSSGCSGKSGSSKGPIDVTYREIHDDEPETSHSSANPYSSTYSSSANPYSSTYRRTSGGSGTSSGCSSENAGSAASSKSEKAAPLPEELKKGLADINDLKVMASKITDSRITGMTNDICVITEKIINELKVKQEKISSCRQMINYYVPTVIEVLTKYQKLEASEIPTDDMAEKVTKFLPEVKTALQNQYDSLFDNDKLNMSVNMEAMSIALRRDGLIDDLGIGSTPLMNMGTDNKTESDRKAETEAKDIQTGVEAKAVPGNSI